MSPCEFCKAHILSLLVQGGTSAPRPAEAKFRDFINGEISDAKKATEVLTCLSADSREAVDTMVAKAIARWW